MARPPAAKEGDKLVTLKVAKGHIMFDSAGVRREGGDDIQLTKAQAAFYGTDGPVTFDIDSMFDDDNEGQDDDKPEVADKPEGKTGSGAAAKTGARSAPNRG